MARLHPVARLFVVASIVLSAVVLLGTEMAWSFSASDTQFYDGLSDLSAFDTSATSGVALDPLGGLRLATDGTPTVSTWTSVSDFSGAATLGAGPLVGKLTLEATGSAGSTDTAAGSLRLRPSPLALSFVSSAAVVAPSFDTSTDAGDAYEVQGPSVIKVADGDYRMYYTGVAPNGYVQRVFEATSSDGISWHKVRGAAYGGAVLDVGGAGAFDERGLVRPAVVYDATSTPPFRMYYGTLSDEAGFIGSAVSSDGLTWTKTTDASGTPVAALEPGLPGMLDGYSVGEPSAVYDPIGRVFRMWYAASPGPDVRGRQVGFATSTNTTADAFGGVWSKGGVVSLSGSEGNWSGGWFSPGAWYQGGTTPYSMLFAGKKSGEQNYKLIFADSNDGVVWNAGNIAVNTGSWYSNNAYWASGLYQPSLNPAYWFYFTGNGGTGDRARNAIGRATWKGSGGTTIDGAPVLSASNPSTRFDSNYASNGSLVRTVDASGQPTWLMVYAGRAATDLTWRLGAATATDAATWTKVDGTADPVRKSVVALGAASFDTSGAAQPTVATVDASGTLAVVYQGTSTAGATSFGLATTTPTAIGSWQRRATSVLTPGGAVVWDASGISHPSLVRTPSGWRLYYAGFDGAVWRIGYASTASTSNLTAWTKSAATVLSAGSAGEFDESGVRDPVVSYDASLTPSWRMWYTALDSAGTRRIALATSDDGISWAKQGLAVCPTEKPYRFDEIGVAVSGSAYDTATATWHVLYDGYDRGNTGVSAGLPETVNWQRIGALSGTGAGYMPDGSAVYECVPTGTPAPGYDYEFRAFNWDSVVPTGTEARYWVSFYPAYVQPSGQPVDQWSKYFALDSSSTPYLPLTTEKIRWRTAFGRDAQSATSTPDLSEFRVTWAPVHFEETGTAQSLPIKPAAGRYVDTWQQLSVDVEQASANASLSVTVLALDGQVLKEATTLTNGTNNVDLSTLPAGIPEVLVRFDFQGDGLATPYVKRWSVDYTSTTRAPVRDLHTQSASTSSVALTWTEPEYDGFKRTRVLRRSDAFPTSPTDPGATIVWDATSTPNATATAIDTSLTAGRVYYYTAYTTDDLGWSPPSYAIGVASSPLMNLTAAAVEAGVRLGWKHGTTLTVPVEAWQGSRVLRRDDATVTTPYDTTATVVGDFTATSTVDTGVVPGRQYRYGAWEHYAVTVAGRTYHTYSLGDTETVRVTPPVVRVAGANRYDVAANIARKGWDPGNNRLWPGVKHLIVACGDAGKEADPLAAAGLAGVYDAPVLLTQVTVLPSSTKAVISEIASANPDVRVHIVGGTASVPDARWTDIQKSGVKTAKDRIAGADRYAVTAQIANRMVAEAGIGSIDGLLIVCSQTTANNAAFFDALAASPIAFRQHMPMLGVQTTSLPASVRSVLTTTFAGKDAYVVSSKTWINDSVYASVGGDKRLTTSSNIYTAASQISSAAVDPSEGWLSPAEIGIAAKLPDALTGGTFMGKRGGVMLFTDSTNTMQKPTESFISHYASSVERGWIFGGTASVPPAIETKFKQLLGGQ